MNSFIAFLEDNNLDFDRIYVDKFYHSIKDNKWILVDNNVLKWCGYYSENKEYKLKQRYLELIQKEFKLDDDYKMMNMKDFNSIDKNSINIMFSSDFSKNGNKTKYLIIRPDCFEDSLFMLKTDRSSTIRKCYLDLKKYFIKYLEYVTNVTIARLKEENVKLKKNQSNVVVQYATGYKPLESNKFIYVMSNKNYISHNLFKIGHTTDLKEILKQNKSKKPFGGEMNLLFFMKVFNSEIMEEFIFSKLEQFRHEDYDIFHINYYMLMDLMKEFERMESNSNNNFNSIISKYKREDIQRVNLFEDIEIISKKASEEAGLENYC